MALVKITMSGLVKTAKGDVKEFSIKIARGAIKPAAATPSVADDDEPPF